MTGISGKSGEGIDRIRVRCTQVTSTGAVGSGTAAIVRSTDEFGGDELLAFARAEDLFHGQVDEALLLSVGASAETLMPLNGQTQQQIQSDIAACQAQAGSQRRAQHQQRRACGESAAEEGGWHAANYSRATAILSVF